MTVQEISLHSDVTLHIASPIPILLNYNVCVNVLSQEITEGLFRGYFVLLCNLLRAHTDTTGYPTTFCVSSRVNDFIARSS